MMAVMARRPRARYRAAVPSPEDRALFERLAALHHGLAARLADPPPTPDALLDLGAAVIFHGALEGRWLSEHVPLLEPCVLARFAIEHERLADDLLLLQSIRETSPQSADVPVLCAALAARLRDHVARDEELIYGAASPP
jgi:hypothetical protein